MIQIKTFAITDSEAASKWLEQNYHLVIQSKDGPEIKVFGAQNPHITILFDKNGQNSTEYKKEALTVELSILNQQLFEYQRQLLDHKSQLTVFPRYNPSKGKHAPTETAGYVNHMQGVATTTNQIKLQIAKIAVVEKLLANPESLNEQDKEAPKN